MGKKEIKKTKGEKKVNNNCNKNNDNDKKKAEVITCIGYGSFT